MFSAIILAGGLGTRFQSNLPKVLNMLAGQTLIESVLKNVLALQPDQVIIVGSEPLFQHEKWQMLYEKLKKRYQNIDCVIQDSPMGTGHAVQVGFKSLLLHTDQILICYGDTPLIQPETMRKLLDNPADLTIGTMHLSNPQAASYGRVLFEGGRPVNIVETRDSTPDQKENAVANAGVYSVRKQCLQDCIFKLNNQNYASEFYLTDMVNLAYQQRYQIAAQEIPFEEAQGINTVDDLANISIQPFLRHKMLNKNIHFQEISSVVFSMDTQIGTNCAIGAFVVLGPKVIIENNVTILPFCHLEDCSIKEGCTIGPFAHIKAESVVYSHSTIGNFVEVKKSSIGTKTKIKHLSYIGDAIIGTNVNIGAGTVICNYDGFKKHQTIIEDKASVGANSSLVAPLHIGFSAFIGAGSVITRDVPAETLALSRPPQMHNAEWVVRKQFSSK